MFNLSRCIRILIREFEFRFFAFEFLVFEVRSGIGAVHLRLDLFDPDVHALDRNPPQESWEMYKL